MKIIDSSSEHKEMMDNSNYYEEIIEHKRSEVVDFSFRNILRLYLEQNKNNQNLKVKLI